MHQSRPKIADCLIAAGGKAGTAGLVTHATLRTVKKRSGSFLLEAFRVVGVAVGAAAEGEEVTDTKLVMGRGTAAGHSRWNRSALSGT
jgi:hypothetical protein